MKKSFALLVTAVALISPAIARADLVGSTVNGVLNFTGFGTTNYFAPANGVVPAGYGNSSGPNVVVGSGIEFGISDGNILYTFDFSNTTLHVTNTVGSPATENSFIATFTDPNFTELIMIDNTIAGLTFGLSGDVLTLNFAGHATDVSGNLGVADVTLATAVATTPEPATFALLGTGLLGLAGAIRRKLS